MSMGDKCKTSLEKAGRVLKCLRRNLVDAVWSNPPPSPCAPMRVHPLKYAGKSSKEKLSDLRSSLKSQKANAQLVCALDEVAWLLNIRGNDIPNTPVTIAYLLVLASEDIGGDDGSSCILFVDENKLTNDVSEHLPSEVSVQPYCQILEVFEDVVKMLEYPPPSSSSSSSAAAATEEHGAGSGGVLIDQGQMNLAMGNIVPEDKRVYQSSPITLMKALKNEAEQKGMRDCHVRDGAALCAFLAWLDEAVHLAEKEGGGVGLLTEDSVCYKLESYRKAQPGFVGPSFPTIAGFGPNGAVIHYKPAPEVRSSPLFSSSFSSNSSASHLVIPPLFQPFHNTHLLSIYYCTQRPAASVVLLPFSSISCPWQVSLLFLICCFSILRYSRLFLWTHHPCSCWIRVGSMRMEQLILLELCIGGRQLITR